MPLVTIQCPHCQHNNVVKLMSLAHNSRCSHCGKALAKEAEPVIDARKLALEHVKERIRPQTPQKPIVRRRRLLSPDDEVAAPGEKMAHPEHETISTTERKPLEVKAYEPQVLDDEVHERMWFDPEVQVRLKWLRWGGGIMVGLLLLSVVADKMNWWTGASRYFAGVTDKLLRTTENYQSAADANQLDRPGTIRSVPAFKAVPSTKAASATSIVPASDFAPKTAKEFAIQTVTFFLRAPHLQERVKYVRQQELWGPRMREYYVRNGDGPVLFERVEAVDSDEKDDAHFAFSVLFPDGQRRKLVVGKSNGGEYLVDWASFVLYSEMDWDKFRSSRPANAMTFRVLAAPSDFFKNGFSDSRNLVCLKLSNPLNSAKPALYAYADRNSAVGRSLAFITQTFAGKAVPLILRLKYPSDAVNENQVIVSEFVGEGWVARSW